MKSFQLKQKVKRYDLGGYMINVSIEMQSKSVIHEIVSIQTQNKPVLHKVVSTEISILSTRRRRKMKNII